MSRDPIGYADGLNMYAYVGNDPVNNYDPMGLTGKPNENPTEDTSTPVDETFIIMGSKINWASFEFTVSFGNLLSRLGVGSGFDPGIQKQLAATRDAFNKVTEANMTACAGLISMANNKSISAQEVFDAVSYDPSGPSQDQVLENASWINYIRGGVTHMNGLSQTESRFPGQPLGDSPADAWRHTFSSAYLTRIAGSGFAKALFDAHEREPGQDGGRLMDLINNHNGRFLAHNLGGKDLAAAIHDALKSGLLITAPPTGTGGATGNLVCSTNP